MNMALLYPKNGVQGHGYFYLAGFVISLRDNCVPVLSPLTSIFFYDLLSNSLLPFCK